MAAPSKTKCWRENLSDEPISHYLRQSLSSKSRPNKKFTDSKDVITVHGSDLFVWDFSDSTILHSNLRRVEDAGTFDHQSVQSQKAPATQYQKLVLSDSHGFEVEGITVNHCCSHIVAWGHHGIRIVELPRRWGAGAVYEGGKEVINCRTTVVGERNFQTNRSVVIRQVKWHPGSKTHSHIAVLTSDNVLSVYDMSDPNVALSTIPIETIDTSVNASPHKSFVSSALGESAVWFDFGAATSLKTRPRMFGNQPAAPSVQVWPVYCVKGNGDVMLLYSHLSTYSSLHFPVYGPLSMFPPAEDNYGVDACSILCLNTPMPILAISTCDGRLYHCVQFDEPIEDKSLSSSPNCSLLYEELAKPILYVIESVELELCLGSTPLECGRQDDDFFMCPIQLQADANSHERYYCVHKAGVHSVFLPWLSVVQQYLLDNASSLDLSEDKECIVEHLFCTKPVQSCEAAPVLGQDVVSDAVLGPSLLILSNDCNLTAIPINLHYQMPIEKSDRHSESQSSSKRPSPTQSFSQYIGQILQRKTSNPLLRSGSLTEPSQQESFQLLSRATQVLREEYIEKQDHAREEIDSRVSILRELKDHQLQDIHKLKETTNKLTENARAIADRLNDCAENYETIRKRLDAMLYKLQSRVPNLSEAERNFMKELKVVHSNIYNYKKQLEGVTSKLEYQQQQMNKKSSVSSPVLQEKQLNRIKSILKEEANEIEDLKRDFTQISKEMILD